MNPNLKMALDKADVEDVVLKATLYAETRLRKFLWRGAWLSGNPKNFECLGDAHAAEDFVMKAMEGLFEGKRSYETEKSLIDNLKSIIDSLISSAKKSSDRKPLSAWPNQSEDFKGDIDLFDPASADRPDYLVIEAELLEVQNKAFLKLWDSLDGDDDARAYLDAMKEEFYKPEDIASLTGLKVEKIYEIRRKVKKHIKCLFAVKNLDELIQKQLEEKV